MADLAKKFGYGKSHTAFGLIDGMTIGEGTTKVGVVNPTLLDTAKTVDSNSILFVRITDNNAGKYLFFGASEAELKAVDGGDPRTKYPYMYTKEGDTVIWGHGKFYANAGSGAGSGSGIASLVDDGTYLTVTTQTVNPDGSTNLKVAHNATQTAGKKEATGTETAYTKHIIKSITIDAAGHITAWETGTVTDTNTTYAFANKEGNADTIVITPSTNGTAGTAVEVTVNDVAHATDADNADVADTLWVTDGSSTKAIKATGNTAIDGNAPANTVIPTEKAVVDYVKSTLDGLDLEKVGANGSYIKFVSQDNGQVSATAQAFDTTIPASATASNVNAPTTKAVRDAIDAAIAAGVQFKGVIAPANLPTTPANGDMYKLNGTGTVGGTAVKAGDVAIAVVDGTTTTWHVIPSGDETESWRAINIKYNDTVTEVEGNAITGDALTLAAGDNVKLTDKGTGEVEIAVEGVVTDVKLDTGASAEESGRATTSIKLKKTVNGATSVADTLNIETDTSLSVSSNDNGGTLTISSVSKADTLSVANRSMDATETTAGKSAVNLTDTLTHGANKDWTDSTSTVALYSADKSLDVSVGTVGTGDAKVSTINIDYTGASTADDWAEL